MVYVSVTGLRLRSVWVWPRFAWHAVRSMRQARTAEGNLFADARRIDGVHHTLTVWTSRDAMRAYLVAGAHLEAMKAFKDIGEGTTVGYTADAVPTWWSALAVLETDGRPAGRGPRVPEADRPGRAHPDKGPQPGAAGAR